MKIGIDETSSIYLMLLYVYLKSYQEAIDDFEVAVKNIGYPDEALMAVKQNFTDRVNRVSKDLAEG
jgi:hypothetical protein